MAQQLLTGKKRLPGFGGVWETIRLRQIVKRHAKRNTIGNTNVLTISAQYGLINQAEFFNKVIASDDKSKFNTAEKMEHKNLSKDVFLLVDESHRSNYGLLATKMRAVVPHACYIGFTGTPLMKKEKNTMAKFGRLIHKYTIRDGVENGAIVPLIYEGRFVE